jgi:hypothetical protein
MFQMVGSWLLRLLNYFAGSGLRKKQFSKIVLLHVWLQDI